MTVNKFTDIIKRDGLGFTLKRSLAFLIGHTPLSQHLSFRFHHDLRLGFAPSMLTYVLFANSAARDEDALVIENFVTPGSICIDVGAHVGSTVLITAKQAGLTGQVIAIEASPKFFKILSKNVSLNKTQNLSPIKLIDKALGDTDKALVYLNEAVSDDTTNYIGNNGTAIKQTTLDTLTADLPQVDFLKIDVEGYEPAVLAGATATLPKTKALYIEFCTKNLMQLNHNQADLIELLSKYFNLHTYLQNQLVRFDFDENRDYAVNLLCLRK